MFSSGVLHRILKAPSPLKQAQLGISELRAQVFQTQFNPTNERSGSRYLRQRPIGSAILPYYQPHYQLRKTWRAFTNYVQTERDLPAPVPPGDEGGSVAQHQAKMAESWRRRRMAKFGGLGLKPTEPQQDTSGVWRWENKFITDQEETRFVTLDRKRRLGKGHPKKGTSFFPFLPFFFFVSFRFVSFRFVSFRYVTLRYATLRYLFFSRPREKQRGGSRLVWARTDVCDVLQAKTTKRRGGRRRGAIIVLSPPCPYNTCTICAILPNARQVCPP